MRLTAKLTKLTIVADDPGTANYGRAIIKARLTNKRIKFKLVSTNLVKNTVRELKTNVQVQAQAYINELPETPDIYVAERYMTRGIGGTLIECVNFMLGLATSQYLTETRLIAAVTWKSQFKKLWDLEVMYKQIKPSPPHLLDAILLAVYQAHIEFEVKPFSQLSTRNLGRILQLVQEIGQTIKSEELKIKRSIRNAKKNSSYS